MKSLKKLSDKELLNRLTNLVKQEFDLALEILSHLIEVEKRKIFRSLGYRSMFVYCTEGLGYSESSACRRIYAARSIGKCPRAYEYLARGRVNLGTLALVWRYLNTELLDEITGRSYREVQAIASRFNPMMKRRDRTRPVSVQKPVVVVGESQSARATSTGSGALALTPEPERSPDLGDIYRRRGGKFSATEVPPVSSSAPTAGDESATAPTMPKNIPVSAETRHVKMETVKMHQVNCLVDDSVMQMLDRCKELMSGKHPRGTDYNTLMMELASDWLERHDPVRRRERRDRRDRRERSERDERREQCERRELLEKRENAVGSNTIGAPRAFGINTRSSGSNTRVADPMTRPTGKKSGTSKTSIGMPGANGVTSARKRQKEPSRYIVPATRDEVYHRDGGRCTFVGSTGKRCGSRWDLEIHHDETPYAMGGGHSADNLRLLCASHNMLEAERVYGRRHMESYVKQQE